MQQEWTPSPAECRLGACPCAACGSGCPHPTWPPGLPPRWLCVWCGGRTGKAWVPGSLLVQHLGCNSGQVQACCWALGCHLREERKTGAWNFWILCGWEPLSLLPLGSSTFRWGLGLGEAVGAVRGHVGGQWVPVLWVLGVPVPLCPEWVMLPCQECHSPQRGIHAPRLPTQLSIRAPGVPRWHLHL